MREPSFSLKVPDGDTRARRVCDHCGFVDYVNPRLVVGTVCTWDDRILLCRRAIPPREGFWTVPAGFLEEGETTEEGAAREALEEAHARVEMDALLGIYNIPHISQVHLFYRARLLAPDIAAGDETQEARLFAWPEVPWSELAFPSVHWALLAFDEVRDRKEFTPRCNPPGDRGDLT